MSADALVIPEVGYMIHDQVVRTLIQVKQIVTDLEGRLAALEAAAAPKKAPRAS